MLDAMECLKDGVPLSLMMDLLSEDGPDASAIYADEPADLEWTLHLADNADNTGNADGTGNTDRAGRAA